MSANFLHIPRAPIWIGAIGTRTPLGLCPASTAAAVRAGYSAVEEHPLFVDQEGEPVRMARDALLSAEMPLADRLAALLLDVLGQLPAPPDHARFIVIVCLAEPRPGLPDSIGEALGRAVSGLWPSVELRLRILPLGHAGGLLALAAAARDLEEGTADMAAVAAVDSFHEISTLDWLDAGGDLKSETNRDGYLPGEAAGACLLVREDRLGGLDPLARIAAISSAAEPVPIRSDGVCVGEGLSAAFQALAPVVEGGGRLISDIYCDLNGQRYRSEELVYTVLRTQRMFVDAHAYQHPVDCWGDVGAASGPLFASLAIAAAQKNYSNGHRAALWAGSESGRRAVALLDLPEGAAG